MSSSKLFPYMEATFAVIVWGASFIATKVVKKYGSYSLALIDRCLLTMDKKLSPELLSISAISLAIQHFWLIILLEKRFFRSCWGTHPFNCFLPT